VATLIPRSDRTAIEAQVLAITRDLLRELGNRTAIEALKGSADLERDLGLASIERVELISRIEQSLGTSLPEGAIAEASHRAAWNRKRRREGANPRQVPEWCPAES